MRILTFDSWLNESEKETPLTEKQITFLNKHAKKWSYNHETDRVDVNGSVGCSSRKLKDFKGIKWGVIKGNFVCGSNNITELDGPTWVGGNFTCDRNRELKSLEGGPEYVGGTYDVGGCRSLFSLKGIANQIGGGINLTGVPITKLDYMPEEWKGNSLWLASTRLKNLEGIPPTYRGYIGANSIRGLVSLEGCPDDVEGISITSDSLRDLKGSPKKVRDDYAIVSPILMSLEGAPESVGGRIKIGGQHSMEDTIIDIEGKDWNLRGWIRILRSGTDEQKALIATLPGVKEVQDEHPEDFEDLSNLADLGF